MSSAGGNVGTSAAPRGSLADHHVFSEYHLCSFMAMEVPLKITPRFSLDRVDCLSGSYGPFAPNYPVDVPLWLALYLRQTDTCTLTTPDYLSVPYLRDVAERERASERTFEPLPFYFYEIAKQLTSRGSGGQGVTTAGAASSSSAAHGGGGGGSALIPHVPEVIRLVDDIRATRQQKLKMLMDFLEREGAVLLIPALVFKNIVCHELRFLQASISVAVQQAASMLTQRRKPVEVPVIGAPGTSGRPSTATVASAPSVYGETQPLSQISATTATTRPSGGEEGGSTTASQAPPPPTPPEVEPLVPPPVKKRRTLRQT